MGDFGLEKEWVFIWGFGGSRSMLRLYWQHATAVLAIIWRKSGIHDFFWGDFGAVACYGCTGNYLGENWHSRFFLENGKIIGLVVVKYLVLHF